MPQLKEGDFQTDYIVSVVGSALQMETQLEVNGKNDKELDEL